MFEDEGKDEHDAEEDEGGEREDASSSSPIKAKFPFPSIASTATRASIVVVAAAAAAADAATDPSGVNDVAIFDELPLAPFSLGTKESLFAPVDVFRVGGGGGAELAVVYVIPGTPVSIIPKEDNCPVWFWYA